jgi:hypothetical protein
VELILIRTHFFRIFCDILKKRWGYFFQEAIQFNTDLWPSVADYTKFITKWVDVHFPTKLNVAKVDIVAWQLAAEAIIGMCRSAGAGEFALPQEVFDVERLPGFILGWTPLPSDPICAPSTVCDV